MVKNNPSLTKSFSKKFNLFLIFLLFFVFSSVCFGVEGLVGYWKFDETSGTTAADSSGSSNNGTLYGGATWTTGKYGNALSFDGNSGVNISNPFSGVNNNFTISMWFKTTVSQGGYNIGGHLYRHRAPSNDVMILLNNSPNNYISAQLQQITGATVDYTVNYNDGIWHYYVLTYNGSTMRVFYDNTEVGNVQVSGNFNWDTNFIREDIGDDPYDSGTRGFIGAIDEVRIYNRALTQAEIQSDMQGNTQITVDTPSTTTVEATDGSKTKIVIPPGALDRSVKITIIRDTTITDGIAYNFDVTDASSGSKIQNFLKPVTITIYYTITNGKITNTNVDSSNAAQKLSIFYYDGVKWNKQQSEIDTINKFLSISTTHASIYAIKALEQESTTYYGGEVIISPNPFTPNNDGVNDSVSFYFDNPNNENTTIKIFSRVGILVRTLSNVTSWNGKDDNGNDVENGLYLWQLEIAGSLKKRGTITLAR